jgi:hypothetical protein
MKTSKRGNASPALIRQTHSSHNHRAKAEKSAKTCSMSQLCRFLWDCDNDVPGAKRPHPTLT